MENALLEWILQSQDKIILTDNICLEKAKVFAQMLNIPLTVTEHFTGLAISYKVTQKIICFDLDMDFLLDNNNMVTAIVMINELIHLVKLYHATVIYCEQNV